ncbi:hypothetical protein GF1_06170 [Desulfolithobacter dissulfuricans]|uniref:Uncharacterized protein n=1 Tax=Desulfolithobacter dissulfuricans TaxID=2795293 RepID=A0A915U8Q3_9BACT|nr:hypothetical protein GF1_06170 [Desulfolithobacter dissulfuricans]
MPVAMAAVDAGAGKIFRIHVAASDMTGTTHIDDSPGRRIEHCIDSGEPSDVMSFAVCGSTSLDAGNIAEISPGQVRCPAVQDLGNTRGSQGHHRTASALGMATIACSPGQVVVWSRAAVKIHRHIALAVMHGVAIGTDTTNGSLRNATP